MRVLGASSLLPLLCVALSLSACRGIDAPYAPGQKPSDTELIAATAPELETLQVPRAKVRQGAGPAANLMLVAQAPKRFSGTIQIAGNELVTLAVNEEAYGLRWIGGRYGGEALTPGYYSGPPSRCAVATLLGVDLEPEAFVQLVLGGAPLIEVPRRVVGQRWDRKGGREHLVVRNEHLEQDLAFEWRSGAWQFVEASLWELGGADRDARTWLWTISHEQLHEVSGHLLPKKTAIRQPGPKGRELVINVSYQKQIANPALGGELSSDSPPDDAGGSGGRGDGDPANAGDSWEDWDEDGEDGGWESADGSGPAPESEPGPGPKPGHGIPPQFVGNPSGLPARGDLCAGRG